MFTERKLIVTSRKSPQMLDLERRHGQDIEQLIASAITDAGSVQGAALRLGVNPNTFYGWIRYLRIGTRTVGLAVNEQPA